MAYEGIAEARQEAFAEGFFLASGDLAADDRARFLGEGLGLEHLDEALADSRAPVVPVDADRPDIEGEFRIPRAREDREAREGLAVAELEEGVGLARTVAPGVERFPEYAGFHVPVRSRFEGEA